MGDIICILMMTAKPNKIPTSFIRISAAAKEAGVSKQTIEYYIMLGLITPRRAKGRPGRYFDPLLIKRIRLIRQLNESGYTLRDIREIYLKREILTDKDESGDF